MRLLRLVVLLAASVAAGAVVAIATRPEEVACGVMPPRGYHGPPVTCLQPGIRWDLAVMVAIAVAVTGLLMVGLTSVRGRVVSD